MIFTKFTKHFPPHCKRLIANIEFTNDKIWPLNQDYNIINTKIWQTNENELGSIWFFPDAPNIKIPDCYGLADGKTLYERKYYTEYFDKIGYSLISESQIIKDAFPNMTSNTTPSPYIAEASSVHQSNAAYRAFNFSTSIQWHSTSGATQWISIKGNADLFRCKYYTIRVSSTMQGGNVYPPRNNWQLQGIKAGSNSWVNISTVSSPPSMPSATTHTFSVAEWESKEFYAGFRLYINSGGYVAINILKFFCESYEDYVTKNATYICPNLQSISPSGFKTYIYMGEKKK